MAIIFLVKQNTLEKMAGKFLYIIPDKIAKNTTGK